MALQIDISFLNVNSLAKKKDFCFPFFLVFAASPGLQCPFAQNNPYSKVAYLG